MSPDDCNIDYRLLTSSNSPYLTPFDKSWDLTFLFVLPPAKARIEPDIPPRQVTCFDISRSRSTLVPLLDSAG
ncbi:MAG: hypothetical protein J6W03_05370 [Bacteroidaceae bacterium]|nr:hypothetical protein [Bacteroidaceae bacterium]